MVTLLGPLAALEAKPADLQVYSGCNQPKLLEPKPLLSFLSFSVYGIWGLARLSRTLLFLA